MFRRTVLIFLIFSQALLSSTQGLSEESLLKTTYVNIAPESARGLMNKYLPRDTTIWNAQVAAEAIKSLEVQEQVSADQIISNITNYRSFTDDELRELKTLLFHCWSMLKLAKNGYVQASKKEHIFIVKETLAFAFFRYRKVSDEAIIKKELSWVFFEIMKSASQLVMPLSESEASRVRESIEALPQTLSEKNIRAAGFELLYRKVLPFSNFGNPVKAVSSMVVGFLSSVYSIDLLKAFALYPSNNIIYSLFIVVGSALSTAALTYLLLPPKSVLTNNSRFKTQAATDVIFSQCGKFLGSLVTKRINDL